MILKILLVFSVLVLTSLGVLPINSMQYQPENQRNYLTMHPKSNYLKHRINISKPSNKVNPRNTRRQGPRQVVDLK